MKKNFKLLLLTLIMGGGFFASEAMALDQVGGVYQIGAADDLIAFASKVNGGETTAKAVLTADIDMSGKTYTPIGNDGHRYGGTFDGQGHVIDHLVLNNENYNDQGIFGVVTGGATIKNLIAGPNNSITGSGNVGGLIGIINGNDDSWVTIENCGNEGYVEAKGTGGAAIVGICFNGKRLVKILNCYNTGNIKANAEAAVLTGWFGGGSSQTEVKNFYNIGDVTGQENGKYFFRGNSSDHFTFENVYDNHQTTYSQTDQTVNACANAWYRWPYDLNFSGNTKTTVWKFVASVNHPRPVAEAPISKDGDYHLIADQHDLYWLAMVVNNNNTNISAKLTSDIVFTDYSSKANEGDDNLVKNVMIGNADEDGKRYTGHFDGQGHTVTVGYDRSEKFAALFGVLGNGAIVENLRTEGSITTSDQHAAGIAGGARGNAQIRNCISAVDITGTGSGDGTHAGICGFMFDTGSITNCAFVGSLTAENCTGNAGLLGYANGGDNIVLTNCYVYADFKYKSDKSDSWAMKRHTSSLNNCYYIEKTNSGNFQIVNDMNQLANKDSYADATVVGSGELCYKLNGESSEDPDWYQTIGTDAYPVPFSTNHLSVSESDGDYYNTLKNIADASELVTFANTYNNGSLTNGFYKVCLTDDINFDGINDFPGIGTKDNRFRGIFDGQGHIISNLTMSMPNENAVGFFRYVTSGGTVIKRFTIDSSCSFTGNDGVGAFVGRTEGRNGDRSLLFEELGNEAYVTANGANGGGILGVDQGSDALITVKNCYNTGTIVGSRESGAFSGWFGDNLKIYNCYNMGTIDQYQGSGLARANTSNNQVICENTYVIQNNSGGNHVVVGDGFVKNTTDFQNGTVFASLFAYNQNGVDGSVWRMYFDADDATKSHPVLNGNAIAMREDCTNRMVEGTYDVKLYRTIKAGVWNTFCAPFAVSTSQFSKVIKLDTDNQDTEVLHFITANAIESGKAYLVKTENAISEINASNVTVSPTITPSTAGGYAFTGVYSPTSLPQDAYVFTTKKENGQDTSKDVIIKVNEGINMNGFRAYLKAVISAPARSFVIDEDGTTGIITATGDVIENGKMYNLGGQRVSQPQRGLYIVNGKKYIK